MNERENQVQPFGICNRLFNYFMQSLQRQAFKTVTLGHPKGGTVHPADIRSRPSSQSAREGKHIRDISSASAYMDETLEQETTLQEVGHRKKGKPLKKMVSINDKVEIIDTSKLKYRRQNTADKGSSIGSKGDEPRPLKSILKVRSRSDENEGTVPVTRL